MTVNLDGLPLYNLFTILRIQPNRRSIIYTHLLHGYIPRIRTVQKFLNCFHTFLKLSVALRVSVFRRIVPLLARIPEELQPKFCLKTAIKVYNFLACSLKP